jgi:hypothetical protein
MTRIPVRPVAIICIAASFTLLAACASNPPARRVWVGPRIDLKPYETIGMVEFTSSSKGRLAGLATRRFAEAARRDQDMVRMVDVGSRGAALASVGRDQWDPDSLRAIGRKHGVRSMFVGTLTISSVRPALSVSTFFKSGQVTAQVDATLEVQMIESETGASIWSRSASATRSVGQVTVYGGKEFAFDADDPDNAYGDLVDFLVSRVTQDFHGRWVTQ